MINIEKIKTKKYIIKRNDEKIIELDLITSTVTNKFFIISNFIERISKSLGDSFDIWFYELLIKYESDIENRYQILVDNVPKLKELVNQYYEKRNIDFSVFIDRSKVKKTSILFEVDELELITKLSSYLKIYAVISNSTNLKLNQSLHSIIYNQLVKEVQESDVVKKIFDIVRTKTFRYNFTDKYMWNYIKMIHCKTIDVHVIEIFNFIMNSIIILCEEDKNPVTYFVSVIDESVKWFLRSVYKSTVIFEEGVFTENIHTLSTSNLKTYSYNNTLGRLKSISYNEIYKTVERNTLIHDLGCEDEIDINNKDSINIIDTNLIEFQNRCFEI
jgi:hypothetical protein